MTRSTLVMIALSVSFGGSLPAGALDFYWNDASDGSFASAPRWLPYDPIPPGVALGPGGVNDIVHFDLGAQPQERYTVSDVAGSNDEMHIHDDSLTLVFSADYTLPKVVASVPNFIVGVDDGDTADVVLTGQNGAVFQPHRSFLGAVAGSSGSVVATGSDWLWDVGHQLMVGWYGTGMLTIEAGADVVSSAPLIGTFDDAIGTVIVRGAGSSWANSSQMSVAVGGTAVLEIEDGGTVSAGRSSVGNSSGALGMVFVRGAGSRWDLASTVFFGYGGTAELTIEDGGTMTAGDAWLGGWADEGFGTATAVVRGAESSWTLECPACDGSLTVGVSNQATLRIEDGGRVANVGGWIGLNAGANGAVIVGGTRARWSNAGQLFVGDAGTGTLLVESGGSVASTDGWIGVHPDAIGAVTVHGADASWDNDGLLFLGSQGTGTLRVEAGGNVSNTDTWMGLLVGSTSSATVADAGSAWNIRGPLRVGYASDAMLRIEAGGEVTSASADIAATFGSTSDVTVTGAGSSWDSGNLRIGSAGTGALTIEAGGAVASDDGTIGDRGTLHVEGAGSLWSLRGSLEMEDEALAGTLGVGISGPAAHGVVNVAGTAQLAGTLEVTLHDGFAPDPLDSFTVLVSGGGIAGAFDNVASGLRLDTADGLGSFRVDYGPSSAANPDHVVLSDFVVPEPDTVLMALVACAALGCTRRARIRFASSGSWRTIRSTRSTRSA